MERKNTLNHINYHRCYNAHEFNMTRRFSRVVGSCRNIWSPADIASSLKALPGGEGLWDLLEAGIELEQNWEETKRKLEEDKVNKGLDEAVLRGHGSTALLVSAWCALPRLIERLLEKDRIHSGGVDCDGRTALHFACCAGDEESVALLLRNGAQPNAWDHLMKATPLHCAACAGSLPCLKLLIEAGADVDAGITKGYTALHYAVQLNSIDCVRELLKAGAKPNTPQVFMETPLHVATAFGFTECIRTLLDHGADVRARYDNSKVTALHLAAQDGNVECARILVDASADVKATNHRRQTPLHLAALSQSTDTVELLLSRGADVNALDVDKRSPLHCSIVKESRSTECVRILLHHGANVNCADAFGYTPLHLAALHEFSTCVGLLINAGADVMARTNGGVSALTFVVRRTPETLPCFFERLDTSVSLHDHDLGDADCELRLDFRTLLPPNPPPTMIDDCYYERRVESALLLGFIEVGMRHLLKHPLCESFLYLKWRRIRKYFLISLAFQILFVAFYTAYVVGVMSRPISLHQPNSTAKMVNNLTGLASNSSGDLKTSSVPVGGDEIALGYIVSGYILIFLNFGFIAKEMFGVAHDWEKYVKRWENWFKCLIIISVFCFHGLGNHRYSEINMLQHHAAAIGIVFTWADLMIIIGRFPTFGVYVQMFTTVSINFAKFLFAYCCLLVGFGLGLGVLLPNVSSFMSPHLALLKSFIMMAGELEYEDIFFSEDSNILYSGTTHVMFLAFVILVTVILTNLLVGLAVSDIQGLQKTARLNRLVRQAELVAHIESVLFSRIFLKIFPKAILKPYLSRALLVSWTPYNRFIHIRPNDPREKRLPRHLQEGSYNLVASRSGRKTKAGNETGPGSRRNAYKNWAMQYSLRSSGIHSVDGESDDGLEEMVERTQMMEFLTSQLSLLAAESEAREASTYEIRRKLERMEGSIAKLAQFINPNYDESDERKIPEKKVLKMSSAPNVLDRSKRWDAMLSGAAERRKTFSYRSRSHGGRPRDWRSFGEEGSSQLDCESGENLRAASISSENEREEFLDSTTSDSVQYLQPSSPTSRSSLYERRNSCFPQKTRYIWSPQNVTTSLRTLPGAETLWTSFEAMATSSGDESKVDDQVTRQETLEKAIDEAVSKGHGDSVLLLVAWHGQPDLLRRLLEDGLSPDVTDGCGRTPLHLVCYLGDNESAAVLVAKGARADVWDHEGKATPVHCAASSGCQKCVKILVDSGADVNSSLNEAPTPIYYAVQVDSPECVSALLEAGANTCPPREGAAAPLHVAASFGYSKCLQILLESGADMRCRAGRWGNTAIHLAAKDGSAECTRILLDFEADPNTTNSRQQTPLHLAALSQSSEVVELLLSRGSDRDAVDVDLRTPLHCAIVKESRCTECINLLLSKGCNVNCPDVFGYTPLHLATLNEFSGCVSLLVKAGADVMARTKGGVSALTFMVRRTPDTVPLFLERLNSSVILYERDLGDADCELRLDFRPLLPLIPPTASFEDSRCIGGNESSLLLGLIEVGMRSALEHPLCETFLFLKWRRIRKFFLIGLCYHLIFITFYTTYIIGVFSRDPGVYGYNETSNGTRKCISEMDGDPFSKTIDPRMVIVGYMVMMMNIASMVKECFQIAHGWVKYFHNWENWLQWVIIVSVFLSHVFRSNVGPICDLYTFQHHVAALATVFIWADLMIQIGRYPTFGVYVQMFTTVSVNFSKLLLAYSCLLIGFGLGLAVLLPNFPAFEKPYLALLTSVIMMSGELEYESIFFDEDKKILFQGTSHVMFLAFVLLMTVILTNLLVGLAVSDIQGLRKTAKLNRLVREVENIGHLESILFSRSLSKIIPSAILKPCLKSALLVPSAPYNMSIHLRPNDPREKRVPRHLLDAAYNLVASRTCYGKKGQKSNSGKEDFGARNSRRVVSWGSVRRLGRIDSHNETDGFDEMDERLQQERMLNHISSKLSIMMEESQAKDRAVSDINRRLAAMERSVKRLIP
ncbi:uncharacterized protein LOC124158196 [Ischnura elegans]|uniref:uncharacterized protein LOC124158196 n=1 Tax=Ischnura elegans TaxID=197161 RepID=UPI001ED889FE|nr:uncharacterized protein LOC124158196 [Ischnura elegans]